MKKYKFLVFMSLFECMQVLQASGHARFNVKPPVVPIALKNMVPGGTPKPILSQSLLNNNKNDTYRKMANATINEALTSGQEPSISTAPQKARRSSPVSSLSKAQLVDFNSASAETASQQLSKSQGFDMEPTVNVMQNHFMNLNSLTTSGSSGRFKVFKKPGQQKVAVAEQGESFTQEPIVIQEPVSPPLLLTYDPHFKNQELVPSQKMSPVLRSSTHNTVFQESYNVIPRLTRGEITLPEQEYMQIDEPNSAPLLLTYDANFKNKEFAPAQKAMISSQDNVYNDFANESFSEQSPAYNQSLGSHSTAKRQYDHLSQQTADTYMPSKTSENVWQEQANRPRENIGLSITGIDYQVQEMPEFAKNTKKVGISRAEKPRFSQDSVVEVLPIIEMKVKNEQQKLPKNPTIQIILNMLTKIKDFILEILGYHPSSLQAQQAISKSMQKVAKNLKTNIQPDGTINPRMVAEQTGLLMQDLMEQQQQNL